MPSSPRAIYAITATVFGRRSTWSTYDIEALLPFLNSPLGEWSYISTVRLPADDNTFWEKYQQHTDGTR